VIFLLKMESTGMTRENRVPKAAPVGTGENEEPSPGEIGRRAYEIFLAHGRVHGRDLDDWLQAERELKEEGR
jgi:DUF2934 family protein